MNRRKMKNRIAFQIWTAVPRVENYNLRRGSDFRDYPLYSISRLIYERSVKYATIQLREVSHQYLWKVTGVFFHIYVLENFLKIGD